MDNQVRCSILGTMQLGHVLDWIRKDDCLVITSGDRGDIIVGALQAHRKYMTRIICPSTACVCLLSQ